MKNASLEFRNSLKQPFRNRGYIRVSLGTENIAAKNGANVDTSQHKLAYFSTPHETLTVQKANSEYATCEKDYSKTDGTMYFVPPANNGSYYNCGIISRNLLGSIAFKFDAVYDIKGLTINFGENYPVDFTVSNDNVSYDYVGNAKSVWETEDIFDATTKILIKPKKMKGENTRLRIREITFGVATVFGNSEVINYEEKCYVSPYSESVPSDDITLEIRNLNHRYDPDNPQSDFSYLDIGSEVKTQFGYDVTGNGDVQWLPETVSYLKTWSANDVSAKFSAKDKFDSMTDLYCKGTYSEKGVDLYTLAEDVLKDAGMNDTQYVIASYLKEVVVHNPLPVVSHPEALQIIANAGRAVLFEDAIGRITITFNDVLELDVSCNGELPFSCVKNVINKDSKTEYAMPTLDYSRADGTMLFTPSGHGKNTTSQQIVGYISDKVADGNGKFKTNPTIILASKGPVRAKGVDFDFAGNPPKKLTIIAKLDGVETDNVTVTGMTNIYTYLHEFQQFDEMDVIVNEVNPYNRATINAILINDSTDYGMNKTNIVGDTDALRGDKIKAIDVVRTTFSRSYEKKAEIESEEVIYQKNESIYRVILSSASYELESEVTLADEDNSPIIPSKIVASGSYYADVEIGRGQVTEGTSLNIKIRGKLFNTKESSVPVKHSSTGINLVWRNPLVSEREMSYQIEKWLRPYYVDNVQYDFEYRGDPTVEPNDKFILTRNGGTADIRAFETTLSFDGSWGGKIKAGKVKN